MTEIECILTCAWGQSSGMDCGLSVFVLLQVVVFETAKHLALLLLPCYLLTFLVT
jgi:hypothetical protein